MERESKRERQTDRHPKKEAQAKGRGETPTMVWGDEGDKREENIVERGRN